MLGSGFERIKENNIMDISKFTIKSQELIQAAQNDAESRGNQAVDTGHLLQAILTNDKDVSPFLFEKLKVDIKLLSRVTESIVTSYSKVEGAQLYLSNALNAVLQNAFKESKNFNDEFVSLELLLYALVLAPDAIGQLLKDQKITTANLYSFDFIEVMKKSERKKSYNKRQTMFQVLG